MRSLAALAALLVVGCGASLPRPLPAGMKGSCEPPGGTISAANGSARPGATIRVTVRDLDGADRNPIARVLVARATGWTEVRPSADGVPAPRASAAPDGWLLRDEHRGWGGPDSIPGDFASSRISAGQEVALASSTADDTYWVSVECDGNGVDALVPTRTDRLLDVTVTLDCTGGWGLPIFGGGDGERDGIGWHVPE
jgi:hypothetical protein